MIPLSPALAHDKSPLQNPTSNGATSSTNQKIRSLMASLQENPAAWQLYLDAQQAQADAGLPPITIHIVHPKKVSYFMGDADTREEGTGELRINSALTRMMQLSILIFELTNFKQGEQHRTIDRRLYDSRYPYRKERYIRDTEMIEHAGTRLHHEIIESGVERNGWDSSMDIWGHWYPLSFKEIYESETITAHKEHYGNLWEEISQNITHT